MCDVASCGFLRGSAFPVPPCGASDGYLSSSVDGHKYPVEGTCSLAFDVDSLIYWARLASSRIHAAHLDPLPFYTFRGYVAQVGWLGLATETAYPILQVLISLLYSLAPFNTFDLLGRETVKTKNICTLI